MKTIFARIARHLGIGLLVAAGEFADSMIRIHRAEHSDVTIEQATQRNIALVKLRERRMIKAHAIHFPELVLALAILVLTVTSDHHRVQSMMEALRKLRVAHSPGAPLFFFTTRDELRASDPLTHEWRDGNGRAVRLT
jgi:hypothetical protein